VIDVFVKVWCGSMLRLNLARAVVARVLMFEDARPVFLYANIDDHRAMVDAMWPLAKERVWAWQMVGPERFWVTSKQYAEDNAESPIYVVIDDDHLPIGKDWLAAGVAALERHPEYAMLASWSINGEVPGPRATFEVISGAKTPEAAGPGYFTRDPDRPPLHADEEVFEASSSIGTPYFVRKGTLGQLPDGPLESYDQVLSEHARVKGKLGFLRNVRHNHLGCGYSQVAPGHWGA